MNKNRNDFPNHNGSGCNGPRYVNPNNYGQSSDSANGNNKYLNYQYYTTDYCSNSSGCDKNVYSKGDLCSKVIECDITEANGGHSLNYAILDTGYGCPKNVCGVIWSECFLDSLDSNMRNKVKTFPSTAKFRFGDGKIFDSMYVLRIPIMIAGEIIFLSLDVVQGELPCLWVGSL